MGSIKLPAVSPQATSSFLSNGEVFREDEKSKKKKKKDTAKEKKKKPKAKEKGKTARISPLEETIKKFNMKGEESSSDYDEDSSESSKPSLPTSPFGTPVRVAFLKGDSSVYLGQKSSGSTLSREINEFFFSLFFFPLFSSFLFFPLFSFLFPHFDSFIGPPVATRKTTARKVVLRHTTTRLVMPEEREEKGGRRRKGKKEKI